MLGRNPFLRARGRTCRKIVVFRSGCCPAAQHVSSLGGRPVRHLALVNAIVADFPGDADLKIAARTPEVLRVDDDLPLTLIPWFPCPWRGRRPRRPPEPPQSLPWGVRFIGADRAWAVGRGEGVRVAVMDTGVDLEHPDLKPNLAGGYNALAPGRAPADDNGHGTHVTGTLAAVNDARGVAGVAPAARVYAVKVLDRWGSGFLSDLVEGLGFCIREGIRVVNLSLGTREDNQTFRDAVRNALAAGLLLVAAAGNDGPGENTVDFPARYADVLAVAAVDAAGRLARFSSRGPEVDLAAPGVEVPSTWLGGTYRSLSGTSMASPHVAGAAALTLGAHPDWTAAQVRRQLVLTARRLTASPYPAVDAAAATR